MKVMGNWFKLTLLLGAMTALIVWIGNYFGGQQGMILAFILAIGMNFFSFWFSDRIVLRMYRAREVGPGEHRELYDMIRQLSQSAHLPMPRVYIIPEQAPNAFATGRNPDHAVIAVTEGLLRTMGREELMGVLAHEMAHVKNRDILIGSIAATMAGAIMILAGMARWAVFLGGRSDDEGDGASSAIGLIVMSILAPLAAMLIQMAISRSREYQADTTGAGFAGNPEGLANALEKLGAYSKRIPMQANPSTAHMFIVNPLSARSLTHMFSTHPPLEQRIARLRGTEAKISVESREDRGKSAAEATWRNLSK